MFEHDYEKYPELTNTQLQVLQFSSPHKQITQDFKAEVVKVHDGDTVTLRTDFRDFDFPLRLLDIDAPEMNEGGQEAREWLKSKLLDQPVQVLINSKQRVGKYGRLLGKLLHRGMDIGQEELHLGLARPFGKKDEGEVKDINYFIKQEWY